MKKLFVLALGIAMLPGFGAAHAEWYHGRYYGGWRGPGWGYYPRPYRYYGPPPVYYVPPPRYYPPPVYYGRPYYSPY